MTRKKQMNTDFPVTLKHCNSVTLKLETLERRRHLNFNL